MKTTYLAAALMLMSLPATTLAAAPSNEDLYNMIIDLKQELKQSRIANQTAQIELAELKGTATTASWDNSKGLEGDAVELDAFFEDSYLTWKSKDNNFKFKIDGRIMLDSGFVDNDQDENNLKVNTEFRRVRFALKTQMYDDWAGEFDLDFADNEVDIKDMWLSYNGINNTIFKLGNHKPAFCMDEVTTSRWTTFMERSMVSDAFSPGRRIGFSGTNYNKYYFAGASVFGDEVATKAKDETASDLDQSEAYGFSTRLVGRPIVSDDNSTIVHVGFNYMYMRPSKGDQADDEFGYKTGPEAHFLDYDFLKTNDLEGVDNTDTYGLELAAKWNKLSFQAEYMMTELSASDGNPEPEYDGYYAYVAYFLTDDQRPYNLDDGEFGAIKPKSKWGAWEIAARYSNMDLNDTGEFGDDAKDNGGEADAITLAVNWYINNNFMIKTNYIHVDYDEYANKKDKMAGDDDLDILGVRFQYLF